MPEPFRIMYEDDEIIVIDKNPGIHVNETETSSTPSVVELLADRGAIVVHRLDRETSGVLVLAKTRPAAARLSNAFRDRQVEKVYVTAACGEVEDGLIDAPLGKDHRRPRARAVRPDGQAARTRVRTLLVVSGVSALEVELLTGRTHQIRVHLAHQGAPILGDTLYRGPASVRIEGTVIRAQRTLLHAKTLTIPVRGGRRTFEADVPADLRSLPKLGLALAGVSA